MLDHASPPRRWPVRLWISSGAAICATAFGQPAEQAWGVEFPAATHGRASASVAARFGGDSLLVAVVAAGADGSRPVISRGGRSVAGEVVGFDPVSRLCFLRVNEPVAGQTPEWRDQVGPMAEATLRTVGEARPRTCQSRGWVKRIEDKVLPLGLLKVVFEGAPPPGGTALADPGGRVVAVVLQGDGTANGAYAIPAEAVVRVARDIRAHGRLVRGWIGLTLRPESVRPQVVRVLEDSPAAQAGIRPGDVVTGIGPRKVEDYADAADAFFYLVPDEPVAVRISRGAEALELRVVPVAQAGP